MPARLKESSPALTFHSHRLDPPEFDGVPYLYSLSGAEPGGHLQHVTRATSGTQLPLRVGHGIGVDADHAEARVYEENVQRQRSVFHPERPICVYAEQKEHSVHRLELTSEHEPPLPLGGRRGDLDGDADVAT